MANALKIFSEQARLLGLYSFDKSPPTVAPVRNDVRFAEALQESLCEMASPFDFSDPVKERDGADFEAVAGEHGFCIQSAYFRAEWQQPGEWVVTIVPKADFRLSPRPVDPAMLKTLNRMVRVALAHRKDVTILTPTEPPSFSVKT